MKVSVRLVSLPLAVLVALAMVAPVAAGPGVALPDAQVRRAGGPQLGDNIYNQDATGQTVGGQKARRYQIGAVRWFYAYVYNDGTSGDDFTFGATETETIVNTARPTGSVADAFKVQYFSPEGTDITSSVDHGFYHTPLLAPGGRYGIKVKVTVTPDASHGSEVDLLINVRVNDTVIDLDDAVRIRMKRK